MQELEKLELKQLEYVFNMKNEIDKKREEALWNLIEKYIPADDFKQMKEDFGDSAKVKAIFKKNDIEITRIYMTPRGYTSVLDELKNERYLVLKGGDPVEEFIFVVDCQNPTDPAPEQILRIEELKKQSKLATPEMFELEQLRKLKEFYNLNGINFSLIKIIDENTALKQQIDKLKQSEQICSLCKADRVHSNYKKLKKNTKK